MTALPPKCSNAKPNKHLLESKLEQFLVCGEGGDVPMQRGPPSEHFVALIDIAYFGCVPGDGGEEI